MSRRVIALEHVCRDCGDWTEVWNDDYASLWLSCQCGGGYASRALVERLAAGARVMT